MSAGENGGVLQDPIIQCTENENDVVGWCGEFKAKKRRRNTNPDLGHANDAFRIFVICTISFLCAVVNSKDVVDVVNAAIVLQKDKSQKMKEDER